MVKVTHKSSLFTDFKFLSQVLTEVLTPYVFRIVTIVSNVLLYQENNLLSWSGEASMTTMYFQEISKRLYFD